MDLGFRVELRSRGCVWGLSSRIQPVAGLIRALKPTSILGLGMQGLWPLGFKAPSFHSFPGGGAETGIFVLGGSVKRSPHSNQGHWTGHVNTEILSTP